MPLVRSRASSHVTLLLAVLALLAATLVPTSPAAAADSGWDPSDACPSGEVPPSPFTDASGVHGPAIDCLAWYQLTTGRTPTFYGTQESLRRDQAASFLVRAMDRIIGLDIPPRERDAFPDVPSDSVHLASIETLAGFDPQIVSGFTDGTFRPANSITRAQFASIATRMLDELADQDLIDRLPDANSPFGDTEGSVHEDNIARLANAEIVFGRSSDRFDPSGDITRGQIASVLTRIMGGLVERDLLLQPLLLSGVIHDATDQQPGDLGPGLRGATVAVSGVVDASTTTASNGSYAVFVQQPADVEVTVSLSGWADRGVVLNLPDANLDRLDVGMYRTATVPAESTRTNSTAADVRVTSSGDFWVVGLGFSAQDADEIVLRYPNGIAIELGAAGTDDAWFSRNPDGTSERQGEWGGTHRVYYLVDGAWQRLDATFSTSDGRLTGVNGLPVSSGS